MLSKIAEYSQGSEGLRLKASQRTPEGHLAVNAGSNQQACGRPLVRAVGKVIRHLALHPTKKQTPEDPYTCYGT